MTLNELIHLLKTSQTVDEIDACKKQIAELIPKIAIMFDFDQRSSAHQFDLWIHSLHVVLGLPRDIDDDMLYLGALLHDIGKPDSQCRGKREGDTDMHYYGHPIRSYEIVKDEILPSLKSKGYSITTEDENRLLFYVKRHDNELSMKQSVLDKLIGYEGKSAFYKLLLLQNADAAAHVQIPIVANRLAVSRQLIEMYKE